MNYNIVPIADGDDGFIKDKLEEYNLSSLTGFDCGLEWHIVSV